MKIEIGMAMYGDFHGVYATVQALRMYQDLEDCGIAVIDNNPASRDGQRAAGLLSQVAEIPARYVPFPDPVGTAAPRQHLFDSSKADFVLCIDPHVMLWPGAIKNLKAWIESNTGYADDLISGPLIYDNLVPENMASHFNDVWGEDSMWGRWDKAWRAPDMSLVSVQGDKDGFILPMRLFDQKPIDLDKIPYELPSWPRCRVENHEKKLQEAGFRIAAARLDDLPFEIPAMGLGLFGCRREAWLGFNPLFRGFGGEEWYIHEKFRRAGRRCLCLPFLRWNHRFADGAVPYPAITFQKIRNYVIGLTEVGIPLDRLKNLVVHVNDRPPEVPIQVWESFRQNKIPQREWDELMTNPASPPTLEQVQAKLGINPNCNTCGQAPQPVMAGNQEMLDKLSLEDLYNGAKTQASDINEHVPKLRELASQCKTVVEFGMRHGVSTVGLLAGQPERFITYDLAEDPVVKLLDMKKGATEFSFKRGSSLEVEIEECDLLFIDTVHTANHLYAELLRHHGKVRKWIAFHDTQIFGERGEDGGPGLLVALRQFMREHLEWIPIYSVDNNHGFMVISRDPADRPEIEPGIGKQIFSFGMAKLKMFAAKITGDQVIVPEEEAHRRLDVCALCPLRAVDRCSKCGCYLVEVPEGVPMAGHPGRAMIAQQECPIGKWFQWRPEDVPA